MNEETRKKRQKNTSKTRFVVSVLAIVVFVGLITIDLPKVHLLSSAQFLDFKIVSVANADTPYLQSGYSYSQGSYGGGDYSQSSYGNQNQTITTVSITECSNGNSVTIVYSDGSSERATIYYE